MHSSGSNYYVYTSSSAITFSVLQCVHTYLPAQSNYVGVCMYHVCTWPDGAFTFAIGEQD